MWWEGLQRGWACSQKSQIQSRKLRQKPHRLGTSCPGTLQMLLLGLGPCAGHPAPLSILAGVVNPRPNAVQTGCSVISLPSSGSSVQLESVLRPCLTASCHHTGLSFLLGSWSTFRLPGSEVWPRVVDCRPPEAPGNGLLPRGRECRQQFPAVSSFMASLSCRELLSALTPFPGSLPAWRLTGRLAILADWGQLWGAALAPWICQDLTLSQRTSPFAPCGFLFFSFHRYWFPIAFVNPTTSHGQSGGQRRG